MGYPSGRQAGWREPHKRREFVAALDAAATWPFGARSQQPTTPVVGFLASTSAGPSAERVRAFRQRLAETGFSEPRNVTIE